MVRVGRGLLATALLLSVVAIAAGRATAGKAQDEDEELVAQRYIDQLEQGVLSRNNEAVEASWAYESNLTEENLKAQMEVQTRNANYFKVHCLYRKKGNVPSASRESGEERKA